MSESIQSSWPSAAAPFEDHIAHLQLGNEALGELLVLPTDNRFQKGYALMASGRGTKSAVEAIGNSGGGKSSFGKYLFGADKLIPISATDVEDTLFGYTNPINKAEFIPGKLGDLKDSETNFFIDEGGSLGNDRIFDLIWDSQHLNNSVVYMTSNFFEGAEHVHEHDDALKSRIAVQLLTGDHDRATTIKIQSHNAVKNKDTSRTPLIPTLAARLAIHQGIERRYPINASSSEVLGTYIVDMVEAVNANGLLKYVNPADARLGEALHDTARAGMLIEEADKGKVVGPRHIAEIAALVLPMMTAPSRVFQEDFVEEYGRRPSNVENAIAVRRAVAMIAFGQLAIHDVMLPNARTALLESAIERYSYANTAGVGLGNGSTPVDIDRLLFKSAESPVEATKEKENGRRGFFRRK